MFADFSPAEPALPLPLPDSLVRQLAAHGYSQPTAADCARRLQSTGGRAATASLLVDLGCCNFLEGEVAGAIAAWRQVISSAEVAPRCRAMLNLGRLYENVHLHADATNLFRSVMATGFDPYRSLAAMAVARCQRATGDHVAAMRTLAELTESLMGDPERTEFLGAALVALGDAAEAAGQLERACKAWRAAIATRSTSAVEVASLRIEVHAARRGPGPSTAAAKAPVQQTSSATAAAKAPAQQTSSATAAAKAPAQQTSSATAAAKAPAQQTSSATAAAKAPAPSPVEAPSAAVDAPAPPVEDAVDPTATLDEFGTDSEAASRQDTVDRLRAIDGSALSVHDRFRFVEALLTCGLVNRAIDELEVLLASSVVPHHLRAAFTLGEIYRAHQMLTDAETMYLKAVNGRSLEWSAKAALGLAEVLAEMGERQKAIAYWELAVEGPDETVASAAMARLSEAPPATPSDVAGAGRATAFGSLVGAQGRPSSSEPVAASDDPMIELPDSASEPVVVSLTSTHGSAAAPAEPTPRAAVAVAAKPTREPTVVSLRRANPYAALAPDEVGHDLVVPSERDPYAELSPGLQDEPLASDLDEPEHWREMLDDWAPDDERPGFFARFL